MVRLVGNISENNISLKPARINAFNLSGGGYKPLKTKHFACSFTLALTLALTLSLALSFSSVLPAFSQEPADDHAYTLTKIEVQDPSNLPANTITKYEWSETENKLTPVYYLVDLKQTTYGDLNGDTTINFGWEKNADGNLDFKQNPQNTQGQTIKYKYSPSSFSETITKTIDNGTVTDPPGASYSNPYQFNSGAGLNNPAGTTTSIDNVLYKDNKVTGSLESTTSGYKIAEINGGAVYNAGNISEITGAFINNGITANAIETAGFAYTYSYGGAIYNAENAEIVNINADFIGNYVFSDSENALGGAIYNAENAEIGNITGDFIGNYASGNNNAYGGAIDNGGTIGNITGDFIGNYASSSSDAEVEGGAINNKDGTIGNITGDFIGNYASSASSEAEGGAIYNGYNSTIGKITGDFIGNYVSGNDYAVGGAIYNEKGSIGNITGDFIGNYASGNDYAYGGAIYNFYGTIGNITGDFIGNYASGNSATGGAIANGGTIGDITGDFIGNYVKSSNYDAYGGAIFNAGTIGNITGDFIGNYAKSTNGIAYGGAIYNAGTIGTINQDTGEITYGEIKNSSFIGNYAESTNGTAIGGAIFSASHLNITADNAQSVFSGNKTISSGIEEQNAIGMYGLAQKQNDKYVFLDPITGTQSDKNPASLTLKAVNNGVIVFDDTIRGGGLDASSMQPVEVPETAFDLTITGDPTGTIYLNNSVINAKVTSENINLNLGKNNVFEQSDFTINSGSLGFINNIAEQQSMKSANINGNINMAVDVDLANKSMDTLPSNTIVSPDAHISVNYLNLLNDASSDSTSIKFADASYANQVSYSGPSPIAYSPIYKYDVSYSTNPEDNLGYFFFNRASSSSGNQSDAFNPAVLTPSVATQAGAYTTQLQTFNYAFQHSDSFMNIPSLDRLSIINNNKYALNTTNFSPLLTPHSHNGFWVKPYASFESIPLNNGPTVSNINYGTLIGYDSDIKQINHGFNRVLTAYIGYNGASQRYQGVDAYQNGGILGSTATFYKGNFFNATTVSVGASVGDATTMYGSENYTMLMAGIGNKFGYNFEFKQGKYILQPNFLMSYSFINTFDYTNAANVRIESDPLHALQLSPGIKFIMNTKNGWQPYLAVNMTWNILDETKVTANDVRLPSMSIDPYVSYGAGIQKCFKDDRFTAYGQAMVHNGGRNGVSLTAGFRWRVGKD